MHAFDIIVLCTVSILLVIRLNTVERIMKARRYQLIFIVDLAMSRDIQLKVGHFKDVFCTLSTVLV